MNNYNCIFTGYDVCGPYGSPPTSPNSVEETKKIQQFLDSVGVVQQIKTPNHKDFATFEARLKTFDKCKKQLKQDTQTLCEAGFYYMGKFIIMPYHNMLY